MDAITKAAVAVAERKVRELAPPGNAGAKAKILGVPVKRCAASYEINGMYAVYSPEDAALLIETLARA